LADEDRNRPLLPESFYDGYNHPLPHPSPPSRANRSSEKVSGSGPVHRELERSIQPTVSISLTAACVSALRRKIRLVPSFHSAPRTRSPVTAGWLRASGECDVSTTRVPSELAWAASISTARAPGCTEFSTSSTSTTEGDGSCFSANRTPS